MVHDTVYDNDLHAFTLFYPEFFESRPNLIDLILGFETRLLMSCLSSFSPLRFSLSAFQVASSLHMGLSIYVSILLWARRSYPEQLPKRTISV